MTEQKDMNKEIKSKFKNFKELKEEYELNEKDEITLRSIIRKQAEQLELYEKIIIQILQPEEFHSLFECNTFSEKEKSDITDVYKGIMIVYRELLKAEVENKESNSIAAINFAHEELKSLKPKMISIIEKLRDSWKKDFKKSKQGYFG